jgi:hypothetical protein
MIGMIYKEKYKEFTEDELVELLKDYQHLNFEAKVQLKETIGGNVPHGYEVEFEKLSELIDEETKGLENLSYLENLGYKLKELNETSNFEIARSRMAKFIDILSIVIGLLLASQIIGAVSGFFGILENGMSAGGFFSVLLTSVLAIVGFTLLFKGIIRVMNLWKFKIRKTDLGIEIKKRLDIGDLFDRQIDPAGLQAIHREEKCVLVYRDGSTEVDLLETNATHRAMETFEAIKNRLTA